jgi:hypothetical protein
MQKVSKYFIVLKNVLHVFFTLLIYLKTKILINLNLSLTFVSSRSYKNLNQVIHRF